MVQADYLGRNEDGSTRSELRAAAFLLFHRVRFGGRAVLGLPCHLVGNGMLFSRRCSKTIPGTPSRAPRTSSTRSTSGSPGCGPSTPATPGSAAPVAGRGRAAQVQRLRWEGGRFHVVRTRLPRLLAAVIGRRRWSLLDAAVDLAVPPLGLLAAASLLGAALGTLLLSTGVAPLVGGGAVAGRRGRRADLRGGRPGRRPRPALDVAGALVAPALVVSRALDSASGCLRGLRATTWERTTRPGEEPAEAAPKGAVAAPSGRTP